MKKIKIYYWIITGLFSAFMLFSAIPDIMNTPEAKALIHDKMGYPIYLIPFLGWAKLLAVIAILVPGQPRIKEWAYAGLVFDLAGATYSGIALEEPAGGAVFMFAIIGVAFLSYYLYHKKMNVGPAK